MSGGPLILDTGGWLYALDVRRILTIDADFSALRMGRRWSKAFELAVPLR